MREFIALIHFNCVVIRAKKLILAGGVFEDSAIHSLIAAIATILGAVAIHVIDVKRSNVVKAAYLTLAAQMRDCE